jgi:hypothetical protein
LIDVGPLLVLARRRCDFGIAVAELLAAQGGASESRPSRKTHPGPIATANKIRAGAEHLLASGQTPGSTMTWRKFQTELCKELGVKPDDRGYGIDTIQAAVRPLLRQIIDNDDAESTEN